MLSKQQRGLFLTEKPFEVFSFNIVILRIILITHIRYVQTKELLNCATETFETKNILHSNSDAHEIIK